MEAINIHTQKVKVLDPIKLHIIIYKEISRQHYLLSS